MEISPKAAIWINAAVIVLTAISTGTLSFSGLVSGATATQIVAYSGVGVALLNLLMHSLSNSTPGPLAPADPLVVIAAQKVADLPANAGPAVVAQAKRAATDAVTNHQP